ncbi:MAG: FecR family protein [Proteobacteria bacterium]|nr:FecR family protein [Pseudomonadota bacterium]
MLKKILFLVALLLAQAAAAAEPAAKPAGDITLLTGRATAAGESGEIRSLEKGGTVYPGEMINTGPNSYLNIKFTDGGRVLLRPNSRFQIEEYAFTEAAGPGQSRSAGASPNVDAEPEGNALFRLLKGGFRAVTGLIGEKNRDNYKVRTPVATIGIRGTDFEARFCQGDCLDIDPAPRDGLYTGVFNGGIQLSNSAGTFDRDAGQYGFVPGFSAPAVGLKRRPRALAQDPMPDPEACD